MIDLRELRKYSYCSVNIVLALIHAAVFAACLLFGDRLYPAWRCGTVQVIEGREYYRLLTSIFLHSGISHLGSNLLVQVLMGNAVERNLGHVKYLVLYLVSGVCGNIVSVLYDSLQGVNTYSVGSSGAVFGVMGALILLIIKGRKKLQSGSSLIYRAAFAVFYAVYSGFKNPYTDNAAHVGGLVSGILLGLVFMLGMDDVDLRDLR